MLGVTLIMLIYTGVKKGERMDENFAQTFMSLLADDMVGFTRDVSVMIIILSAVFLFVALLFRRGKERNYFESLEFEKKNAIKKALKEAEKYENSFRIILGSNDSFGLNEYSIPNSDYYFSKELEKNEFENELKKSKEFLRKNETKLAEKYMKNIFDIYWKIFKKKTIEISPLHLFFFSDNFPHQVDVNFEGEILIDAAKISKLDLISFFDEKNKVFSFSEYLFLFLNLLKNEELEMNSFLKVKELFKKHINLIENPLIAKTKVTPKIVDRESGKEVIQELEKEEIAIEYEDEIIQDVIVFNEEKIISEVEKKILGLDPEVFLLAFEEEKLKAQESQKKEKSKDAKIQKNKPVVKNKNKNKKLENEVRGNLSKDEESKDLKNSNMLVKDGKFTTVKNEVRKEIRKDITAQVKVVEELQQEIPKEEIHELQDVQEERVEQSKKIEAELLFKIEEEKISEHNTQIQDDVKEKVSDSLEVQEEVFEVSKKIKKKRFVPVRDLVFLFKKSKSEKILQDVPLIFLHADKIYISSVFLFMLSKKYFELDEEKFESYGEREFYKLVHAQMEILFGSRNVIDEKMTFKVTKKQQVFELFYIIEKEAGSKKLGKEYTDDLRVILNLTKTNFKEINLFEFLSTRGCCDEE